MLSNLTTATLCAAALAGCFASDPETTKPSTGPWETVETTTNDGQIIIQKVSYRSGDLRIFGQVCRPATGGPFPLIVRNHGGASGIWLWNGGFCKDAAKQGFMHIESSYRGEDGSDGKIELCAGEVDDTLAMLEIARGLPEVDTSRIAMWGESHGGCITTRALQRGAQVTVAANVFGIGNMTKEYEFFQTELAAGRGPVDSYRELIEIAHAAIGGPPSQFPEGYRSRSTELFVDDLPADIPYLIVQGTADVLVPPIQSCNLARAMGLAGHHFDVNHQLVTSPPAGCEDAWTQATTAVAGMPASRYLFVYDGLGHQFDGTNGAAMINDVAQFLATKLEN